MFLATGALLDRRKLRGAATPFVAVGLYETITGAVVLGGNESILLAGLLVVAAGTVVGLVGGHGDQRRASTWIGVITVFGGLVAIMVDIAPDSGWATGGIALGFALVLGGIAWFLAPGSASPTTATTCPCRHPRAPVQRRRARADAAATETDSGAPRPQPPVPSGFGVGNTTSDGAERRQNRRARASGRSPP